LSSSRTRSITRRTRKIWTRVSIAFRLCRPLGPSSSGVCTRKTSKSLNRLSALSSSRTMAGRGSSQSLLSLVSIAFRLCRPLGLATPKFRALSEVIVSIAFRLCRPLGPQRMRSYGPRPKTSQSPFGFVVLSDEFVVRHKGGLKNGVSIAFRLCRPLGLFVSTPSRYTSDPVSIAFRLCRPLGPGNPRFGLTISSERLNRLSALSSSRTTALGQQIAKRDKMSQSPFGFVVLSDFGETKATGSELHDRLNRLSALSSSRTESCVV